MDEDRLGEMLARGRYRPTAAQTELFVQGVMAALPPTLPPRRWLGPAFGIAFAALAISLLPLYQAMAEQPAALLYDDGSITETVDDFLEVP